MNKIIKYFIKNPLIVNVFTVFILLAGFFMYASIQREGYPDVEEPGCSISAVYPGASPEDVELNVAIPIEKAIKDVDGIKRYSTNCYENYVNFFIEFDDNLDSFDKVKEDIRRNIDNISDFPNEMKERPKMEEWKAKNMPIITIGIQSKNLSRNDLQKRTKELRERLLETSGISKVDNWGLRQREIHIKVNLEKMNSMYITFQDILTAIKQHNIQITSGSIKSFTSEKNIITLSKFSNLLDVKNIILRSNMSGNQVILADVADVYDSFEEENTILRFDGNRGIVLFVYKKGDSDIVKTVENVKETTAAYEKEIGSNDVKITMLMDNSESTKSRLKIVQNNALSGLLLVTIILFVFLSFKNALWTVLGIPFSICFGLMFLPAFGVTINSVSLLGIIIVLGMLVDDAIVISENIYRHRLKGETGSEDSSHATLEVGFAVLTTVLTTVVAFIPLYFMKGVIGSYIKEIPIIISLLLIGSLIESMFILPTHTTHRLTKFQKILIGFVIGGLLSYFGGRYFGLAGSPAAIATLSGAVLMSVIFHFFYKEDEQLKEKKYMIVIQNIYSAYLNFSTGRITRYLLMFVFISVVFAAGLLVSKKMKFEMFPAVEANIIDVNVDVSDMASLLHTSDVSEETENYITGKYDSRTLRSLVAIIGGSGKPEHINFQLFLTPESKRTIKSDTIINDIRDHLQSKGIFKDIRFEKSDGGPNLDNSVSIQVSGNDDKIRREITDLIYSDLKAMKGSQDIIRSDKVTKDEIKIIPNHEMIARHGLSAENIAEITRIAYGGLVCTEVQTADEMIPYRMMLDDKYRRRVETLNLLMLPSKTGDLISIKNMVNVVPGQAQTEIKRFNGKRTTRIYASFDSKDIKANELFKILDDKYKNISQQYPGFKVITAGAAEVSNEALSNLTGTLFIAIGGIYVLLVLLFRSLSQPVIVIFAIPFGMIGVIFAFFFNGMPMSFMGFMGAIGLSGVVVNDALVMVEYINQQKIKNSLEKNSLPLREVVSKGAVTRLRPILLTTITTFGGLFPATIGLGGSDPMVLPAAVALSYGLLFSTVLVLILLPGFYLIENDIKTLIKIIFSKIFRESEKPVRAKK
ncbi:MAG: efflux RND transporter permease subunit [Spirochaetes bacterium]|nr:efflux RND transporter permease subunit [Spirochaetota bacterium]